MEKGEVMASWLCLIALHPAEHPVSPPFTSFQGRVSPLEWEHISFLSVLLVTGINYYLFLKSCFFHHRAAAARIVINESSVPLERGQGLLKTTNELMDTGGSDPSSCFHKILFCAACVAAVPYAASDVPTTLPPLLYLHASFV